MTSQEKFDLTGRVAVVTGGAGLLGAEFCRTLAEGGAAVAIVDLNASTSQAVSAALRKSGYKALAAPTDIVQANDLPPGIAMTDAKGARSRKPHQQANPDTYVHIVERTAKGVVISGTKAIVTGASYMHEFLVMPCRNMGEADADFAICCAVPVDAAGITIVAALVGEDGPAERAISIVAVSEQLGQRQLASLERDTREAAHGVGLRLRGLR